MIALMVGKAYEEESERWDVRSNNSDYRGCRDEIIRWGPDDEEEIIAVVADGDGEMYATDLRIAAAGRAAIAEYERLKGQ